MDSRCRWYFSIPVTVDVQQSPTGYNFHSRNGLSKNLQHQSDCGFGVFKFNEAIASDFLLTRVTLIFSTSLTLAMRHRLASENGSDAITEGVTVNGTAGSDGASTTIIQRLHQPLCP